MEQEHIDLMIKYLIQYRNEDARGQFLKSSIDDIIFQIKLNEQ